MGKKRILRKVQFIIEVCVRIKRGIFKTQYLEEIGVTGSGKPTGFSTTPKLEEAARFDRTNFAFIQLILDHILGPSLTKRQYRSVRVIRVCAS